MVCLACNMCLQNPLWLSEGIPANFAQIIYEAGSDFTHLWISSYDLPGINVKIQEEPLTRRVLDKDTGLTYNKLDQTLTYMLKIDDTEF